MELMFVRYIIHQFIIKILNLKLKTKKTVQLKSRFKYKLWKRWAVAGGTGWDDGTHVQIIFFYYVLIIHYVSHSHNHSIISELLFIQFNSIWILFLDALWRRIYGMGTRICLSIST